MKSVMCGHRRAMCGVVLDSSSRLAVDVSVEEFTRLEDGESTSMCQGIVGSRLVP